MVRFELNGTAAESNALPNARLLDVLREEFGLTAVKEGCGEGECGACSVLVEGRLMNSCITAIGSVTGKRVTTLEGFRGTERYRLLEKAFADAGAVQCGYCTPGMIMAAESLLNEIPHPTEADVREAISGNLCRCTGYNMIIDAIFEASRIGGGLW